MKNRRSEAIAKITGWLVSFLFVAALATGGVILYTDRQMRKELLVQSNLVAGAVDLERVKGLTGTRDDVRSADFLRLRKQFEAVRAANPKCRLVSLMGRKADGPVFFFLDVQDDGRACLPPGQPGDIDDGATPELIASFSNGIPFVERSASDAWDTVVSAVVPLVDPHTGQCVAVLGMDFDARDWMWDVAARAALPVAFVLLALIGLAAVLASSRRATATPKTVFKSLMPTLAILLILLFTVAIGVLWSVHRANIDELTRSIAGTVMAGLKKSVLEEVQNLSVLAKTVAVSERTQEALRSGDEKRLSVLWRSLFETLKRENDLTYFYFSDAARRCVLRIDQPKKSGDPIDQFTIREAELSGKPASGFDMGLRGTPVLRMVQPIYEGKTLLGYVGVGKEVNDILKPFLALNVGVQVVIATRKSQLDHTAWDAGRHLLGRESDWDRLRSSVVIYASQKRLADVFAALFDTSPEKQMIRDTIGREISDGGKVWRFAVSPLKDSSGAEVGDLMVLCDITELKANLYRDIFLTGTAGGLVLVIGAALVFVLLRRADAGLFVQQAKLRESEKLLSDAEELAQTGSWKMNLAANRFTASAGTYRIFGCDPEEATATYEAFLELIHGDDRAAVEAAYSASRQSRKADCEIECRIVRRDSGETRTVRGHYVHERDDAGGIIQTTGMVQDVTEQKRAEADQKNLEAQLIVAQKMESVGRLAGGVAHDFNNMLQAILGYTDLALEQVPPGEPLHDDLEAIKNAAQHSAQLTQQLLGFARRQVVVPKVIALNDTIGAMLKILRPLIGENIDLSWRPGTDIWPVKIDPVQMDQILANLCVNARDAIAGVGKIIIETSTVSFDDAGCVLRAGFVPGDYVLLAVSDTGCGMDTETRAHIFEPFFSTKELGKGTGLGLATVYGAVRQNHGFVNVYSEPGKGTTFNIYLPRHSAQEVPETGEARHQSVEVTRGSETILLVEDELVILKATRKMLERLGYTVLAANTPDDALRLAAENVGRIDLLMTDVMMPKMNGRDLADALLALYPNLKCLFMSGYTADVIANQGVLDEGVHFLQKPFSTAKMGAMLREVLEG